MSTPVEQIKSRLSIVDVVGSYIKLTKAGGSYKALCPFHNEKSPSFNVSPSREAFYCFGCNRGGDIFTFVESIEGVEFIDALKILAERAGVELKREASESRTERDRLLELMEDITVFYQRHMLENSAVKEYLTKRGLTEHTIRSFRIGYAPLDWRFAYEHLSTKGFTDGEIERAGLIKTVEGKSPYDRFRGRVMFPIFDANGHVVAFSGRVFGEQKNQDGTDVAKYINSPEGPLYDKSSIMFGYDRAKKSIRAQNFTILVEGQMDLIMSHQAGTENTVAVSGTALTGVAVPLGATIQKSHLALLKRLSDNLVFAFDADEAGLNATARAFRLALGLGMGVRVAAIPTAEGESAAKDPADYIQAHTDPATGVSSAWAQVIASSQHIIDFYLTTLASRGYDARTFRQAVEDKVLPLVIEMQSKIEQAHFIIEIARKLGVPDTAVWEEVKRIQLAQRMSEPARGANQDSYTNQASSTEIRGTPIKTRRQVAEEEIIGIILWQESLVGSKAAMSPKTKDPKASTNDSLLDVPITEPAIDVVVIRQNYHERIGSHGLTPYSPGEDERRTFALKAEYKYEHGPTLVHSIDELLDTIEEEVLKEKQAALWQKLSDAEARGAKDEAKTFLEQYQEITPRIIALEDRRMKRN